MLFALVITFIAVHNINAQLNYVDEETPAMEKYEADIETAEDNGVSFRSAVTLSIPKEGVYDNIKDTKNAKGVMTERKFYNKGKLVEKRTYTQTGSTDCRMRNKYLYYSNGSTVYTHRTYSNSGKTCYNLQTKKYSTSAKLQSHFIYEAKVNGKVKESRDYDISGTYYTQKSFYKNGVLVTREYWKGSSGNYITHIGTFNTKGTNWTKVVFYYNANKDIKDIVNYTGLDPNTRTNLTHYNEDGENSTI